MQPNIEAKWYKTVFSKRNNKKWTSSCEKCKYKTGRANHQPWKSQAKSEKYSRCNNMELSGIPNDTPENNLEKLVVDICHDSSLEIAIVYQFLDTVGTPIKESS